MKTLLNGYHPVIEYVKERKMFIAYVEEIPEVTVELPTTDRLIETLEEDLRSWLEVTSLFNEAIPQPYEGDVQ